VRTSFHWQLRLPQIWVGAILVACSDSEGIPGPAVPQWAVTHEILPVTDNALDVSSYTLRADEHGGVKFPSGSGASILGYNANGAPSPTLGRRGKGPGEFTAPWRLGFVGDTTWVFDQALERLTFFDERNALARTVSLSGSRTTDPINLMAINAGGIAFLVEGHNPSGLPSGADWSALLKAPCSPLDPASLRRDAQRIDSVEGASYVVLKARFNGEVVPLSLQDPFSDSDLMAFAPNGSLAAIVRRKVTNTSAPSFTLTIHGTSRVLRTGTIRSTHALIPITDSLIEAAWLKDRPSNAIKIGAFPSEAAARNAYVSALKAPSHLAAVANVLVGNDSTIWLEHPSSGTDTEWQVYDTRGRVLGQFKLPKSFTALTASGDFIWGTEPDDEGQPRIARYHIARR
jgi:hypothetical protein